MKLEAPETRGALALLADWEPDFFIDLHTTNGSYHGYALTYAPGLNPNSGPGQRLRTRSFPAADQGADAQAPPPGDLLVRQLPQPGAGFAGSGLGDLRSPAPVWHQRVGLEGTAGNSQRGIQQRAVQGPHRGDLQLPAGGPVACGRGGEPNASRGRGRGCMESRLGHPALRAGATHPAGRDRGNHPAGRRGKRRFRAAEAERSVQDHPDAGLRPLRSGTPRGSTRRLPDTPGTLRPGLSAPSSGRRSSFGPEHGRAASSGLRWTV